MQTPAEQIETPAPPFGITKEEVLELAAEKLADQFADASWLGNHVEGLISERVSTVAGKGLTKRVEELLSVEMEKILREEIVPVNIWGERDGRATTIRASIAERARDFWAQKIDDKGNVTTSYSAKPRHQVLLEQITKEQFVAAIKENITELTLEFKTALKKHGASVSAQHIEKLIRVKG